LEDIASELNGLKTACQKKKLSASEQSAKWKWLMKSGKIKDFLHKAERLKSDMVLILQYESLQQSAATLEHQRDLMKQLVSVKQSLADSPM
jgi:hypothetical protein